MVGSCLACIFESKNGATSSILVKKRGFSKINGRKFENVVLKLIINFCNFFEKTHFTTKWLGRFGWGVELLREGGPQCLLR